MCCEFDEQHAVQQTAYNKSKAYGNSTKKVVHVNEQSKAYNQSTCHDQQHLDNSYCCLTNSQQAVATARVWNSLPQHVTSTPSVAVFRSRPIIRLFSISYPTPCVQCAHSDAPLYSTLFTIHNGSRAVATGGISVYIPPPPEKNSLP